ncbi:MAG: [protein-PII] uridylyltransferase [Candidatus Sumerlaeaceae bacterium]|nr:[protein-PII] uridylyltransferase [Candidatus Sumerlaeaceae bacterium]
MNSMPPSGSASFQLDLDRARRAEFLRTINESLQRAREQHVRACLHRGGVVATQQLADAMDGILRRIAKWLVAEASLSPSDYQRIAIVAQGGYGRQQLNLYSDVDLLFLLPDKPTPTEQAFVTSFLYMLWDLRGIELGHAAKRLEEALSAVGTDLDSTTTLIHTRLIFGDATLLETLRQRFSDLVCHSKRRWFVEAVLESARTRHEKYGRSVYLLEPNIKEGEGGLRDAHTLLWLAFALLGKAESPALVEHNILEANELLAVAEAMDFLLSVRSLLHETEGRKADTLTQGRQPAIAKALRYRSDAALLAEEKMMKDYYLRARCIDRYSRKAVRLLTTTSRSMVGSVFDALRERSVDEHYCARGDMLLLKKPSPEFFLEDPPRVMECFWLAASTGLSLSDDLKGLLTQVRSITDTNEFRSSPRCRDAFMRILGLKSGAASALHQMHETMILMDYLPEFLKLFCLVRVDYYHRYTVDEHSIKAVEVAEELVAGRAKVPPDLYEAARSIRRWDLLNLALLLHDIGKGEGHGHVIRGAGISQKITQRMGLPPEDQEIVRQLVLQHLKMVHVSQRRDLDDPRVIKDVADAVGDEQLLAMLYVLSYCDTSAVGPDVWTDWKAALMSELYRKTCHVLAGHELRLELAPEEQTRIAEDLEAILGDQAKPDEVRAFLSNVPSKYLYGVPVQKMAQHFLMRRELSDDQRVVWATHDPEGMNYTELTVVAYDAPGLLSVLCGALSSRKINILSVQVYSTKDGYAIDTFQVTDLRGNRLPHGMRLDRLRDDVNKVLRGAAHAADIFPHMMPEERPHSEVAVVKPPQILIDNDTSPAFTIVEVKTYDRPALLYDITSVCADMGFNIHLALITTEAYRVVDVFYLTDTDNNKLIEERTLRKLTDALMKVI